MSKHSFVKANITKRGLNGKQITETGIVLGNMKQGGHIRQIKDLGSNPGSRVGSQKAHQRMGDQTTIIKKQQINMVGQETNIAERFAPGPIIRGGPKFGIGAPGIIKVGNGSARGIVRESGSQGRN